MPQNIQKILFLIFVITFDCCAADSETVDGVTTPGFCALSCDGSKIGSNDMRVRFLYPEAISRGEIEIFCGVVGGEVPLSVSFVIEKPRFILPSEQTVPDVLGGEIETTEPARWVPASGIAFAPFIAFGGASSSNHFPGEDFQEPEFQGVNTPPDQWCTDTCGVGRVSLVGVCPAEGEGSIELSLNSGSLFGNVRIGISTQTN